MDVSGKNLVFEESSKRGGQVMRFDSRFSVA